MQNFIVTLEQNGDEYEGELNIQCERLEVLDRKTLKVNGAKIQYDEDIKEVRRVGEGLVWSKWEW